jgi:hypothetical protein
MTYIVEPTTSGADSCPRSAPVENVAIGRRFFTLVALISVSPLNRVEAKSFAGRTHWPSSAEESTSPFDTWGAVPTLADVLPVERDGSGLHDQLDATTTAAQINCTRCIEPREATHGIPIHPPRTAADRCTKRSDDRQALHGSCVIAFHSFCVENG